MALKILLADDSMTAQNMGKKILVDAGYDVIAVSNGAAAMKKIASDRPDIVILDVYMPGYSGDEVCERVKASPETAQIPVLLTVGKMEPFNPEKANKAKADGVMIKPFEATDLIAAVQAMSARKPVASAIPTAVAPPIHIPTQKIEGRDKQSTLRIPPPASVDDTLRIPPPIQKSQPSPSSFDDTIPVAPPAASFDSGATVRLTADQLKAFQDASYQEWMSANSEEEPAPPAKHADPEHIDTVRIPPPQQTHVQAEEESPLEMPVAPAAHYEAEEVAPAAPVFSAMPVEAEAPSAPAFAAAAMEAPVLETEPEEMPVTTVYQPQAGSHEEVGASAPFFGVAEHEAEPMVLPVSSSSEAEPEAPTSAPVLDYTQAAEVEPTPMFVAPEAAHVAEAPVLETNAPATPGPALVELLSELETHAPSVHDVVAPAEPQLEINSPIHLQEPAAVASEPALVTNDGDMSEFTTRFGVEHPDEISVGVVSDLTPEQIAAITTPVESATHIAEPEPPQIFEPGIVQSEVSLVSEMPVHEPVVEHHEEAAYVPEVVEAHAFSHEEPVVEEPAQIAEEIPVQASPSVEVLEPRVDLEGPSTDAPIVQHEAEVRFMAEPELEEAHEIVEPQPERVFVKMDFQPDDDAHEIIEPEVAAAPEVIEESPVDAVAAAPQLEEHEPVAETSAPVVEAGLAAAAVAAVGMGAAYVAHEHFAPAHEEEHASAAVETPAVEEHAAAAHEEPMGDAELAEELAAALAHSEAQERAKAAAEAAANSALEPAVAAAVEPVAAMSDSQGWTDAKLAEAISRAIEHLKPQLIQEIVTELMKK